MKRRILPFIKSITISGIIFVIGYAISSENRIAGTLFLALYSTFMVVRAYRKPIPLGFLTAVLPGLMAFFSYSFQSNVMDHGDSDLPMIGLLLGIVPGIIMGITHRVYPEKGRIWAKKSFPYLLLWGISYLITQTAALMGIREISGGALAITGFTTSSLMVLSVFLVGKYLKGKRKYFNQAVSAAAVIGGIGILLAVLNPASSEAMKVTVKDAEEGLAVLISHEDIVQYFPEFRNSREDRYNLNSNPLFGKPGNPDSSAVLKYANENVGRLDIQIWAGGENSIQDFLEDPYAFDGERFPHSWTSESILVYAAHGDGVNGFYEGQAQVEEGQWFVSIDYDDYSESVDVLSHLRKFALFLDERLSKIEYEGTDANSFAGIPVTRAENKSPISQDVADAGAAAALIQLLVAALMAAAVSGASSAASAAAVSAIPNAEAMPEETKPSTHQQFIDPDTEEPLAEENGQYRVWGKWVDADEAKRWVREREEAQAARSAEIDQRFVAERADRKAESGAVHRARGDRYNAATDTWYTADYDNARLAEAAEAAEDNFNAAMLEKNRLHAADRLRGMLSEEGQNAAVVDEMITAGQWDQVCDMFRDRVYQDIRDSVQQNVVERRWATAAQVGEYGARIVEAGAKAGIAVLAGPAGLAAGGATLTGMGAAAVATGAIGAAGETTSAYFEATDQYGRINLDNRAKIAARIAKGFGAGFLSGAKDGAVGVYCGSPGAGKAVKVLLPAGCDAAETYLRTGNLKQAAMTGALSAGGEYVGSKVGGIGNVYAREAAGTAFSATAGGLGSVVNGGSFGEGAVIGVLNRVGSRIGDTATQSVSGRFMKPVSPDAADTVDTAASDVAEAKLQKTLDEAAAEQNRIIPIEDQPGNIQDLHRSMHDVVETDPETGAQRTVKQVDAKKAFDQLADTASSRSAKRADPELQEAINRTREKELYDPANQATIDRVIQKPEVQSLMKPGDKLVIRGYSTPGSTPKVGADRDAILCIARPLPGTDPVEIQMIQIDGKHWHNEAYEEWHKHTSQFANRDQNGNITPETEPEYHRRLEEMDYLKKRPLDKAAIDRVQDQARKKIGAQMESENKVLQDAGQPKVSDADQQARIDAEVQRKVDLLSGQFMSGDQIKARAWAASRNQVFTDPYHVEASRDNSNQVLTVITDSSGIRKVVRAEIGVEVDGTVRPITDTEGEVRMGPGIREGQKGLRNGLIDGEGFTNMLKVKPADYIDGNMPEAVAQFQKGTQEFMKLRAGLRQAGVAVPPLKPHVAEATEILSKAPMDASATPEKIQEMDTAIRAIRRPDPSGLNPDGIPAYPSGIREAVEKLPEQNRILDMAIRARSVPHPTAHAPVMQAAEVPEYVPQEEGSLASDANRSAMRNAASSAPSAEASPATASQSDLDPGPQETDALEKRIRKLDEERARLTQQIAERKKQTEGEQS